MSRLLNAAASNYFDLTTESIPLSNEVLLNAIKHRLSASAAQYAFVAAIHHLPKLTVFRIRVLSNSHYEQITLVDSTTQSMLTVSYGPTVFRHLNRPTSLCAPFVLLIAVAACTKSPHLATAFIAPTLP